MKLSKASQRIITIGILIILVIGAGIVYGREAAQKSDLNAAVVEANQRFLLFTKQKSDLNSRKSQAETQFASYQGNFDKPSNSIEIQERLFQVADDTNVDLTTLTTSSPATESLNGASYQVYSLRLSVEGANVAALISFIDKLSEEFPNLSITRVNIRVSEGSSSLNDLNVKVYTYG